MDFTNPAHPLNPINPLSPFNPSNLEENVTSTTLQNADPSILFGTVVVVIGIGVVWFFVCYGK